MSYPQGLMQDSTAVIICVWLTLKIYKEQHFDRIYLRVWVMKPLEFKITIIKSIDIELHLLHSVVLPWLYIYIYIYILKAIQTSSKDDIQS